MTPALERLLSILTPDQKLAADWQHGAALVLAGPGVGKTTVLTTRIARILDAQPNQKFRVLGLTYTTKAGDEMRSRLEAMVPTLMPRAVVGTFHSFCAQLLRQHGSHVGVRPNFGLFDREADRQELLREALSAAGERGQAVSTDDVRWLGAIDRLRSNLVSPQKTSQHFSNPREGSHAAAVHKIYEEALREANVCDFNGLILDACRLAVNVPVVAQQVRDVYSYWLIDEFQDTTPAQYLLLKYLAGDTFRNIFAVADDDQIIFQFAGASYQQLVRFRKDFQPAVVQLVENRRCPKPIVVAANNVISRNSERTDNKLKLVATIDGSDGVISVQRYADEQTEADAVAAHFTSLNKDDRTDSVVLARTRTILEPIATALQSAGVATAIVIRRDRFLSPHFIWLQSCLELALRPLDKRVFMVLVAAANKLSGSDLDGAVLVEEAVGSGVSFLERWANAATTAEYPVGVRLSNFAKSLLTSRASWWKIAGEASDWLGSMAETVEGVVTDAEEDASAWSGLTQTIRAELGQRPSLEEFLQGIALRPKEPQRAIGTVRLMTIHSAKGLEFKHVWLAAAVEDVLPSWQSRKQNARATELEEERRNFFVAITRTREQLIISGAESYRGRARLPSRFIDEMADHGLSVTD